MPQQYPSESMLQRQQQKQWLPAILAVLILALTPFCERTISNP
jgi:hypothetical protein